MIPILIGLASVALPTAGAVVGTAVAAAVVDEIKERQQNKATNTPTEKRVVSEEYVRAHLKKSGRKFRKVGDLK